MAEAKLYKDQVVVIQYDDLVADVDLTKSIAQAYGKEGLGIMLVDGIPDLVAKRDRLLPMARTFANLPEDIKEKYVHAESYYARGWSHGKEKMSGGRPDFAKGSYYANPIKDVYTDDAELVKKHPDFYHPNIWPDEDMPEFKPAFKEWGNAVFDVGLLIMRQCDRYVRQCLEDKTGYEELRQFELLKIAHKCQQRLLHYFAVDPAVMAAKAAANAEMDEDGWCGWHNDHGTLTGLPSAIFTDAEGKVVPNPDPEKAGLYIKTPSGESVHLTNFPKEMIAFQIGETAQIMSGGHLRATPHAVRASCLPGAAGISRNQCAVFMDPNYSDGMTPPKQLGKIGSIWDIRRRVFRSLPTAG